MSGSPIEAEQVSDFERQNGVKLPEDYREFVVRTDGNPPRPNACWVPDWNDYVLVEHLYGIALAPDLSLQLWLDEYRDEMPAGFIIIGGDPGGAFFLLDASEEQTGVYFWDHQHWHPASSEEHGNTLLLAKSFAIWINTLCDLPQANSRNV